MSRKIYQVCIKKSKETTSHFIVQKFLAFKEEDVGFNPVSFKVTAHYAVKLSGTEGVNPSFQGLGEGFYSPSIVTAV